MNNLNRFD